MNDRIKNMPTFIESTTLTPSLTGHRITLDVNSPEYQEVIQLSNGSQLTIHAVHGEKSTRVITTEIDGQAKNATSIQISQISDELPRMFSGENGVITVFRGNTRERMTV